MVGCTRAVMPLVDAKIRVSFENDQLQSPCIGYLYTPQIPSYKHMIYKKPSSTPPQCRFTAKARPRKIPSHCQFSATEHNSSTTPGHNGLWLPPLHCIVCYRQALTGMTGDQRGPAMGRRCDASAGAGNSAGRGGNQRP